MPGIRLERSQAKRHARRHCNFQMRKKQVGAQMYFFMSAPISSNERVTRRPAESGMWLKPRSDARPIFRPRAARIRTEQKRRTCEPFCVEGRNPSPSLARAQRVTGSYLMYPRRGDSAERTGMSVRASFIVFYKRLCGLRFREL